jgi:hypothetical protein
MLGLLFRNQTVQDALLCLLQRLRDADLVGDVDANLLAGRPAVGVLQDS